MALTKLTTDLIDGTIVTSVNGSTGAVTLETGTDWQATPKTANFTAVAGEGYFVNTTSTEITVTLPSSPSVGNEINLVDYAGTANTNNIIITSSDNINGLSNDVKIDYERGGVSIVYVDATQGWVAYNAANETATALINVPNIVTVDYLVIAGGGGSGNYESGGGGAGGLRTSYANSSSLNGHNEATLSLTSQTNYTVTVGAGGASHSGSGSGQPGNGYDSVFSTIASTGGGRSGVVNIGAGTQANGGSGGSGGGSAEGGTPGSRVTSPVSQGYGGGNASYVHGSYNDYYESGGGGGGASQAGSNFGGSGNGTYGGNGGAGLAVNIISTANATTASIGEVSGSNLYFSGGGAGGTGSLSSSTIRANGGIGGGGNGFKGQDTITSAKNGAPNTGGGAGGQGAQSTSGSSGGQGGSGLVILRYPSSKSITVGAGITEASGSPFTEGSDKVSVFTGGTGTITFGAA